MAKESSFKNMVLSLFIVCLVSSALLGFSYAITKAPIDAAAAAKVNSSISAVVPEYDNAPSDEMMTISLGEKQFNVYPAKKVGEVVGYAVETFSSKGFGGNIYLMVGFTPEGSIYKVSVLSHTETPGLGDKIDPKKSNFGKQFEGKIPSSFHLAVKKDGGDVDAITASTITSRAYCDALETAYKVFCSIEKIGE